MRPRQADRSANPQRASDLILHDSALHDGPLHDGALKDDGLNESAVNDHVVLGRIIGFYGLQGWVKIHSDTDPRENIVNFKRWWLSDSKRDVRTKAGRNTASTEVIIESGRRQSKNIIAKLAGVNSREDAAPLVGLNISVPRSHLPALSTDEVYWTDLIGCDVVDQEGQRIGSVKRLFDTGANDVVVVKDERAGTDKPAQEILIPWIRPEVITLVDLEQQCIKVDWDPDF